MDASTKCATLTQETTDCMPFTTNSRHWCYIPYLNTQSVRNNTLTIIFSTINSLFGHLEAAELAVNTTLTFCSTFEVGENVLANS